ncbi:hypothetical protein COCC4DRAFT_141239 [Bipolaris maydis ATCC 48331]|uniref:Carrier domain-containing protein n=2 Tax=Cochliobolus heterostrophus TaxID=5016 RepID=M2UG00_COCH5|nr:uncharacterized protein COCC4DRAFT_141239 [Bipolaris maydis ATCC 48331]EMD86842.1 hypothetical protein COCHEDRAFT_1115000 [Bipolaris maydis C5]KAH7559908.1 hypothetical protein BM1_03542 [Bipolaris maydis]ENI04161.1 hypothetical protein COCC4DRAFT_141239 [Bipolaris maydis ATCC 48331]KAJ5055543.1 hypothetical protein J3E74DRAFT_227649 [Bipolaris maydis]KAJ6204179.1 hypothetical protein PSV09DRAFT_1115000 [Bipolaris maydis]
MAVTQEPFYPNIDQLIRDRAKTHVDKPILSYADENGAFQNYTGADIERLTRAAATAYRKALPKKPGLFRVALVGVSSLDYYIAFFALQRLGLTSMFLSPRLADQGYAHLLAATECQVVIAAEGSVKTMERVRETSGSPAVVIPLLNLQALSKLGLEDGQIPPVPADSKQEFVIHSGGTTGLPKPVVLSPSAWLAQAAMVAARMPRANTLTTLPLFHSFGLATLLRCLVNGTTLAISNANRPITASIINASIERTSSKALVTVPYILKFFTEIPGGIERLGSLTQVIVAGSAIPNDLAEVLLAKKARIYHLYGLTEAGALMEAWPTDFRWVTPLAHAVPFLKFEPVGEGNFHLVVMPGLPAKVYSNREDGSYATKDVFRPHPTDPAVWRFVARQDDIIVLINGEKADPTPLEDAVSRNLNVRAAVVFGAERDSLGMIVVASDTAKTLSKEEILESIAADLDLGNSRVPGYARISPDAVIVKKADTPFPRTDKDTVIKPQFLKSFAADIEEYYEARSRATNEAVEVSDDQIASRVRHIVTSALNLSTIDDEADFFALGMDSLQASNVRSSIVKSIHLRGATLATNAVFEHANISLLTRHLLDLRQGLSTKEDSSEALAQALLEKYSNFTPFPLGTIDEGPSCVLLTGATGAIGSHLLHNLLTNSAVAQVYCPVRASDCSAAYTRIHSALEHARLLSHTDPATHLSKIVALPCDFTAPNLGLSARLLTLFSRSVTHIIHNAWSVNFNHSLRSFEQDSLRSTHFLLTLAASSLRSQKPVFTFVSSIAAALCAQPSHAIPETLHPWCAVAGMGYGQSKWVAEHMAAAAAETAQVPARVVRLGQVCGDTEWGTWNSAEAFPMTVQAARTIGALPVVDDDEEESWLPVDVAAEALAQIALSPEQNGAKFHVLHVVNEAPILWNAQFLPRLEKYGLEFEAVPQREWVHRLEASDQDVKVNPPFKLLEFFKTRYGSAQGASQPKFETTQAKRWAPCLEGGVDISEELVGKFLRYWMEEAWVKKPNDGDR